MDREPMEKLQYVIEYESAEKECFSVATDGVSTYLSTDDYTGGAQIRIGAVELDALIRALARVKEFNEKYLASGNDRSGQVGT